MVIPSDAPGQCEQWASMVAAGTLPTATIAPDNADTATPSTTKMCVSERQLTNEAGCVYRAGA
jgi:hypothetical protein